VLESFNEIRSGIDMTLDKTDSLNQSKQNLLTEKLNQLDNPSLKEKIEASNIIVFAQCKRLFSLIEDIKKLVIETDCDQTYENYKSTYRLSDPKYLDVYESVISKKAKFKKSLGDSLQAEINNTRKLIVRELEMVQGDFYDEIEGDSRITLRAEVWSNQNRCIVWAECTFKQIPRGAAIALLTKFQNDIKNAESEYLNQTLRFISQN
jgi:hypothetical protein